MANSQTVMLTIRSSRPTFRNNHDKLAFALHASFLASGFDLIATGRPAFADEALTSSNTQDEVGIEGWNEFDGEYAFVYKKGSKKYLVKCLAIHDKLLVDALANGGTEPAHLELDVGKYAEESLEGNYAGQYKNLDKLVSDLQNEILFKLDEGLKPVPPRAESSSETNEQPRYYGGNDPRPQIHPGLYIPPVPGNGGYSDLYPCPPGGIFPSRGGGGGGGSMFVGPTDPRFFPQFGDQPGFMGPPQPGVPPPGARYDPIGPGYEPDRLARHLPRRPGGRHPDLEHFPDGSDFI